MEKAMIDFEFGKFIKHFYHRDAAENREENLRG
jgi:hypothetical protein